VNDAVQAPQARDSLTPALLQYIAEWAQRYGVRRLYDPHAFTRTLPPLSHTMQLDVIYKAPQTLDPGAAAAFLPAEQAEPAADLAQPGDGLLLGLLPERSADPHAVLRGHLEQLPLQMPVLAFFSFGPTERRNRVVELLPADLEAMFRRKPQARLHVLSRGLVADQPDGLYAVSFLSDGQPLPPLAEGRQIVAPPTQSLALCMIVQDAEPMLWRALKPWGPLLQQAVFVDTGSARPDRLEAVLSWFRAEFPEIDIKVVAGTHPYFCRTCGERHPVGEERPGHDFAGFETPRNEGLQHVTTQWVCWPDADEELIGAQALPKYLRPNCYNGYGLRLHHFSAVPPDATKIDLPCKLFRTGLGIRFYGRLHEHPEQQLNHGIAPNVVLSDVDLAHMGYLSESVRRERFQRNWPLMICDQEAYPQRILGRFLFIRDLVHLARYEIECKGGQMTPRAHQLCQEAIRRFRDHFLSEISFYSLEALDYYSDALRLMGEGADLDLKLEVARNERALPPQRRRIAGRFANAQEAARFVTACLESGFEPLTGGYLT